MKEGGSLDPVGDIVILSISPEAKWHNTCLELFSLGPLEVTGTDFSLVSLKAPASLQQTGQMQLAFLSMQNWKKRINLQPLSFQVLPSVSQPRTLHSQILD